VIHGGGRSARIKMRRAAPAARAPVRACVTRHVRCAGSERDLAARRAHPAGSCTSTRLASGSIPCWLQVGPHRRRDRVPAHRRGLAVGVTSDVAARFGRNAAASEQFGCPSLAGRTGRVLHRGEAARAGSRHRHHRPGVDRPRRRRRLRPMPGNPHSNADATVVWMLCRKWHATWRRGRSS
jgi:hypothetical protein